MLPVEAREAWGKRVQSHMHPDVQPSLCPLVGVAVRAEHVLFDGGVEESQRRIICRACVLRHSLELLRIWTCTEPTTRWTCVQVQHAVTLLHPEPASEEDALWHADVPCLQVANARRQVFAVAKRLRVCNLPERFDLCDVPA